jgi:hypothetical protein
MLLDVMWNIENIQQVNDFINSLPPKDNIDARSLLKIAIEDSLEYEGELDRYSDVATKAIDKAQKS